MKSGILGDRVGWRQWRLRNGRRAWGPGNVDDSLLVGSSRMDQGTSAENTRMFFDKATGAFRAGVETGTDWDPANLAATSVGIGYNAKASSTGAVALGGDSTHTGPSATGSQAVAIGANTVASGSAAVALGYGTQATATQAVALVGGTASGSYSFVAGLGSATALAASVLGGYGVASRYGQRAYGSGVASFAAVGDIQASGFVMSKSTTDATATELALDTGTTYLTIPNTRTMSFHIKVAAHRTDVSGTAAAWPLITGGITRDATGNCRLLGSVTGASTTSLCDAGGSTWSVAVTADSTNNRLAVTVTGENAKTIRWVASVELAEVG